MIDPVSAVRSRLSDPADLCRRLGFLSRAFKKQRDGVMILCPWHNERTPSCSVTTGSDGTTRVKCHGCGATGDALHLVAVAKSIHIKDDFRAALEAAAELAGVDLEEYRQTGTKPQTLEQSYFFRRICETILAWSSLEADPDAAPYLLGRGLFDAALADGWSVLPPDPTERAKLLFWLCRSFGEDRVVDSGLAHTDGGGGVRWKHEAARLCIPYRQGGVIRALQRRMIAADAPKGLPKYVWAGVPGIAYNEDASRGDGDLAFTEGAADALALRSLAAGRGWQLAAVGVPGSAWDGIAKRLSVSGRRVYVATDNEPGVDDRGMLRAGERYVVDWAADLYAAGAASVARLRPLGVKDWGELAAQLKDGDTGGDLWEIEEIPRAITPDDAWTKLAELSAAIKDRGVAPELDGYDIRRIEQALDAIKARLPSVAIEFIDTAMMAREVDFGDSPIAGFPMRPGPPTIFAAYSFTGKTIVLQDMLLSIAMGSEAWHEFGTRQCAVVHLDYEQGAKETIDRYHRLLRGRGMPAHTLADIQLRIAVRPTVNLWSDNALDAYCRVSDGVGVCLIDTFRAAAPGQDENDARIGDGLQLLGAVSERTGCIFVVAHHIGKAGANQTRFRKDDPDPRSIMRGHSSIFDSGGYCFHLGGRPKEPKRVTNLKGRNLGDPPMDDFYLALRTIDARAPHPLRYWNPRNRDDGGGFEVRYMCLEEYEQRYADHPDQPTLSRAMAADPNQALEYIQRKAAEGRPVADAGAMAQALKVSKSAAFSVLNQLRVDGRIKRTRVAGVNVYMPV